MSAQWDVVVVGAGIGGLSAAIELAARGHAVVVIERGSAVGGKMRTVEVGISLLRNQYNVDFPLQMTAATLVSLPIMIIFFFAQEYFMEGINLSGTNK